MIPLRAIAALALTIVMVAACGDRPPESGAFPPNPRRSDAPPLTLVDTVPAGQRCTITGGKAPPITVTTPRLIALYEYGKNPVIDCFGEGYFRQRKAMQINKPGPMAERMVLPGAVDPAFAPYPKQAESAGGADFPSWIRIRLHRNSFNTISERDQYYADEMQWTAEAWDSIESRLKQECQSRPSQAQGLIVMDAQCKKALRVLAERRAADRASVEVNRRQSTIR